MVDPKTENRSAWYELGYKDNGTLIIRIHQIAMKCLASYNLDDTDWARGFKAKFPFLESFVAATNQNWGFSSVLVATDSASTDWINFECSLPAQNSAGDKREWSRRMIALRATLEIFFNVMWLVDEDTKAPQSQLMFVNGMAVHEDQQGGSLNVTFTPMLTKWLRNFPESELPELAKALYDTQMHMCPGLIGLYKSREFRAICHKPNRLYIKIPGDACELTPDVALGHNEASPSGYMLCPHNVDSGLQQITFLMGLAKLHDLARKDGV